MYCAEVFLGAVYTPEEIIESQNGYNNREMPNVEILVPESEPEDKDVGPAAEDLSPEYEDHMSESIPSSSPQTAVEMLKGKMEKDKPKKRRPRKKKEEAA
jgi:hypothetical protein